MTRVLNVKMTSGSSKCLDVYRLNYELTWLDSNQIMLLMTKKLDGSQAPIGILIKKHN